MIGKKAIDAITETLIDVYHPLKIYLFGSYAWGKPQPDSDLDFMIVVSRSTKKSYERPIAGYQALQNLTISKDLLVLTQKEFNTLASDKTTLCYRTKINGKLLYSKPQKMAS